MVAGGDVDVDVMVVDVVVVLVVVVLVVVVTIIASYAYGPLDSQSHKSEPLPNLT